jgi:hypothetical protein
MAISVLTSGPLTVGRTIWEVHGYFPKATNAGQRFTQVFNRIIFRDTIMEDGSTLETDSNRARL